MILEMIAWRDPNVVRIAAFYGDDLKVTPGTLPCLLLFLLLTVP
jgi:hypothetical protein